jgi:hypothetical protein
MTDTPSVSAGWYPDPESPGGQRYWTGHQWTEDRTPPPPGVGTVLVGRLLGIGTVCGAVGVLVWVVRFETLPPCLPGAVRFIDLTLPLTVLMVLLAAWQGLAWWRWRVTKEGDLAPALPAAVVIALLPTLLLTVWGIVLSVRTLGQTYDPGCWSF